MDGGNLWDEKRSSIRLPYPAPRLNRCLLQSDGIWIWNFDKSKQTATGTLETSNCSFVLIFFELVGSRLFVKRPVKSNSDIRGGSRGLLPLFLTPQWMSQWRTNRHPASRTSCIVRYIVRSTRSIRFARYDLRGTRAHYQATRATQHPQANYVGGSNEPASSSNSSKCSVRDPSKLPVFTFPVAGWNPDRRRPWTSTVVALACLKVAWLASLLKIAQCTGRLSVRTCSTVSQSIS